MEMLIARENVIAS